jgi:proteic killer suppression protein
MIRDFKDRKTEALFLSSKVRGFPPDILERARRKLAAVNAANTLDDLKVPPSNRLELLKGDRAGQHSIRVNEQWRICFRWIDGDATEVELCDYH